MPVSNCSVQQCAALCCIVVQSTYEYDTYKRPINSGSVLQCVAVCCSVLQRVAVYI